MLRSSSSSSAGERDCTEAPHIGQIAGRKLLDRESRSGRRKAGSPQAGLPRLSFLWRLCLCWHQNGGGLALARPLREAAGILPPEVRHRASDQGGEPGKARQESDKGWCQLTPNRPSFPVGAAGVGADAGLVGSRARPLAEPGGCN